MRSSWLIGLGGSLCLFAGAAFTADADDDGKEDEQEQKVSLDQVPKAVTDAVKAKFPKGELKGAEMGKDDGVKFYEVGLKMDGKSVDVVCKTDGTILEIEKEVAIADLPKAVTNAINGKYPNAKLKEAEEVTEFAVADEETRKEDAKNKKQEGGKQAADDDDDEAEGDELVYEVEITTAGGKSLEVEVTPAGKILEAEADDDEPGESDDN
jgi:uncharacterized membrane protein YkoI